LLRRRRLEETPFLAGGKSESEVRPVIPGEGEEGPVPAFATKNCRKFREGNSPEIRDEVGSRRRRRARPEAPPRRPLSASIATLALVRFDEEISHAMLPTPDRSH